ncbi:hypothetical protein [Chitinophaga pinensis]|uniref:Uncharacterized protein n=1 Tax=Chitinophaga pinensis (strain ATCC 43595 / DSM 2588 / LMG 13176 / NBRC 15968 / NCIMB 11800 / UQM 2034) TaxID=485918 RepID=A0A979G7I4_CHIPD|nr:hypothetical protein [Chitinophaga pinensis]ACU62230.1 hypothetical protein Cpin_4796 [Chitinophaga pinensis DSM 2588]
MKYFGIEVFDAKIYTSFLLEENEPLSSQSLYLDCDQGALHYPLREFNFWLGVGWYGNKEHVYAPGNEFRVEITGGRKTECRKYVKYDVPPDLKALKAAMQEGVDLLQEILKMSDEEIDALPSIAMLVLFFQRKFPRRNITPDTLLFDDLGIGEKKARKLMEEMRWYFNYAISDEELQTAFLLPGTGMSQKGKLMLKGVTIRRFHEVMIKDNWFDLSKE